MGRRVAGCDLGKASASFAVARIDDGGGMVVEDVRYVPHDGKPLDRFEQWYREQHVAACAALAATGVYAAELGAPVLVQPEDSCQEAALEIATRVRVADAGGEELDEPPGSVAQIATIRFPG